MVNSRFHERFNERCLIAYGLALAIIKPSGQILSMANIVRWEKCLLLARYGAGEETKKKLKKANWEDLNTPVGVQKMYKFACNFLPRLLFWNIFEGNWINKSGGCNGQSWIEVLMKELFGEG